MDIHILVNEDKGLRVFIGEAPWIVGGAVEEVLVWWHDGGKFHTADLLFGSKEISV